MPFKLIKGTFHVAGYSPDGDSLRFKAAKKKNWGLLNGRRVTPNKNDHVLLRFEGVDTLETHFKGMKQPKRYADAATDFTLAAAGINNVVWNSTRTRVKSANDGNPGYILSRETEKNRRPVAFVFEGTIAHPDGSDVFLSRQMVRQSLNYQLLKKGLAYPTYYEGLFSDLRQELTNAVKSSRRANRGLWAVDKSKGVAVKNLDTITNQHPIFPKLFRRLASYLKENNGNVSGFRKALSRKPESILILSARHFTNFHNVVGESSKRISLSELPENIVFRP